MGTREFYQKVVIHACVICGDETELARKLDVPVAEAVDWLLGERPVPTDRFLKAAEIVLAATQQRVKDNRAFLEQVRNRRAARKKSP